MAGRKNNKTVGLGIAVAALAAAMATELRKPQEQREWHGKIAGVLPYDLRPPTPAKLRDRMWDVNNRHLIVPHAFGVGWTVNLGCVYWQLRELLTGGKPTAD